METVIIVITAFIQLVTLIVFFVMASNVAEIKTRLNAVAEAIIPPKSEPVVVDGERLPNGLLVVETKTGRQMRIRDMLDNGKYKCYSGGLLAGEFAESEFMEFEQWVKEYHEKGKNMN